MMTMRAIDVGGHSDPDGGDVWAGVSINWNVLRKMNIIIMVTAEAAVDDKDED